MSRRGAIGMIGGVFAGAVASSSFGIDRAFAQPGQLPQQIYVIRHGEKPIDESGPPFGVDIDGNRNQNSLSPKGWERAGALTALFSPAVAPKMGLRTRRRCMQPPMETRRVTKIHRPYETILGLSERLGMPIQSPELLGQEAAFADAVLSSGAEVVLICYEHRRIPALVAGFSHRRWHRHPQHVAGRPIRRHLDAYLGPCRRTLRVQPSPPTTLGWRHRHSDLIG